MKLKVLTLLMLGLFAFAAQAQEYKAKTAGSADIGLAQLELLLLPLTDEQLVAEAKAWQTALQEQVTDISEAEIELLALTPEDEDSLGPEQIEALEQRREALQEMRETRAKIIDRLDLALDQVTEKFGRTETNEEPDFVLQTRRYIDAVDGIRANVVETRSAWSEIVDWARSPEGGQRLFFHFLKLLVWVIFFWVAALALTRVVNKGLDLSGRSTIMLKTFISRILPRAGIIAGFLFGLAWLGISITPILAVVGGASFVIAFALQDSLSNFASGIMIMFYKPFDVDDVVNVAGVEGVVQSMTLVSTTVTTFDNKMMIVPNNTIWQNIITNVTGSHQRRVDLVFGIGYGDDMDKTLAILQEMVKQHPLTLDEPKPLIKVHELADSSVNFICRPWVKTDDYWSVYWDLTKQAKERFDAAGISIPFPQRDVHLFTES